MPKASSVQRASVDCLRPFLLATGAHPRPMNRSRHGALLLHPVPSRGAGKSICRSPGRQKSHRRRLECSFCCCARRVFGHRRHVIHMVEPWRNLGVCVCVCSHASCLGNGNTAAVLALEEHQQIHQQIICVLFFHCFLEAYMFFYNVLPEHTRPHLSVTTADVSGKT